MQLCYLSMTPAHPMHSVLHAMSRMVSLFLNANAIQVHSRRCYAAAHGALGAAERMLRLRK
jgi:hypothetical protein